MASLWDLINGYSQSGAPSEGNTQTLGQAARDVYQGLINPQAWQEVQQATKRTQKVIPSVLESLGRGSVAQVPGTLGDISALLRQLAPQTTQQVLGDRIAPTTDEILGYVPRMTPNYQGSESHEMMGGLLSPALGYFAKAIPTQMKGMPIGNMIAYHGTPHEIQGGFDMAKIGTGEGAQSYGHGMYFAENPAVATEYRKALSGKTYLNEMPSDTAYIHAIESFREAGTPLDKIPSEMKKAYKSITDKDIQLAIQATEKGNLYKVDIPDKDIAKMMNWDEPFSKQPKLVQDAFLNILKHNPDLPLEFLIKGDATGGSLIQAMDKKKATDLLLQQNVKGIKYLDEGSRGNYQAQTTYKGKPYSDVMRFYSKNQLDDAIKEYEKEGFGVNVFPQTHNFVSFEPQAVKILEKNGKKIESLLPTELNTNGLSKKEYLQEFLNKIAGGEKPIRSAVVLIGDKIFTGNTHTQAFDKAILEGVVRKEGKKFIYPEGAEVNSDLFMLNDGSIVDRLTASRKIDVGSSEGALRDNKMQIRPSNSMPIDEYMRQAKIIKKSQK